jgi:cytidine deaminase
MVTAEQRQELIAAACTARPRAYAPYSQYRVGAAVLAEDGRLFTGVNVENASYGLTICAEQAAVVAAVNAGSGRLLAVAVCTANGVAPCGACRQVLGEFGADIPVYMVDDAGRVRETSLAALIPDHFGPAQLA